MIRTTEFSPDRVYRYTLWRDWFEDLFDHGAYAAPTVPFVQFIGLNPSTADEVKDDNTIRCCRNYAKKWGFKAMCMTNLFAFRATDPRDMKRAGEPIGEWNNKWLSEIADAADLIIAAWGAHGSYLDRAKAVTSFLPHQKLHCLSLNADGSPHHPLYLSSDLKPMPL